MKDKLEKRRFKIKRPRVDWYTVLWHVHTIEEMGYYLFLREKPNRSSYISMNRCALAALRHYRGQKFIKWVQCQVAVLGFDRFLKEGTLRYED